MCSYTHPVAHSRNCPISRSQVSGAAMEHPWLKAAEQWLTDHRARADSARRDLTATLQERGAALRRHVDHFLPRNDFHQPLNAHPLASLPFAAIGTAASNISALLDPKNACNGEVSRSSQAAAPSPLFSIAMSTEQVARRLDGLPVFTVSNSSNEFILISDMDGQKSLGLFCFRKEDADTLLAQVGGIRRLAGLLAGSLAGWVAGWVGGSLARLINRLAA